MWLAWAARLPCCSILVSICSVARGAEVSSRDHPGGRLLLPRIVREFTRPSVVALIYVGCLPILYYGLARAHNGWLYLVPPLLGPPLGAVFLVVRPFNPYRSVYAALEHIEDRPRFDQNAGRLIARLASPSARAILCWSAAGTSGLFGVVSIVVASLQDAGVPWDFRPLSLVALTVIYAIFSLAGHYHLLLRWALSSKSEA